MLVHDLEKGRVVEVGSPNLRHATVLRKTTCSAAPLHPRPSYNSGIYGGFCIFAVSGNPTTSNCTDCRCQVFVEVCLDAGGIGSSLAEENNLCTFYEKLQEEASDQEEDTTATAMFLAKQDVSKV